MPRYVYRCRHCEVVFQVVHSIKKKLINCEDCGTEESLQRIPSMPQTLIKKRGKQDRQVGCLVKEYIEDIREELKDEKEELSTQVYKDD